MPTVNIYEARTKLAELADLAASGTDVVITRRGKAVARITRLETGKRPIRSGLMEGEGWMADDFDWPLPDEVQARFEGRR
ncbi:MAG TPA: type II toxin-antitoxin system prevent-host-death family antitoxin [Terracidiphilus sp.]|jgi:prevent-host-death family protein